MVQKKVRALNFKIIHWLMTCESSPLICSANKTTPHQDMPKKHYNALDIGRHCLFLKNQYSLLSGKNQDTVSRDHNMCGRRKAV
jgi:hypothetical protein